MLCVRAFTAIADHDQTRLHAFLQNPRKYLDAVDRSLNRTEIRDVDQQRLVLRRERFAQAVDFETLVIVLANEIRNNLDVVEVKDLVRGLFQVIRDRSHAVRLNNSITRDWQI